MEMQYRLSADYGEIQLEKVRDPSLFWHIIDLLVEDGSRFFLNRNVILSAFKRGSLYTLRVAENDEMFRRGASGDDIFNIVNGGYYNLPCFCIAEGEDEIGKTCTVLWVHSKVRGQGLGRNIINLLGVENAREVLEQSVRFWEKCGFVMEGKERNGIFRCAKRSRA